MHILAPLVVALTPLLITPGLLSYFDITPKIAVILFGLSLSLLYPGARISELRRLMAARPGRWFTGLICATWLWDAIATVCSSHPLLSLNGGNWRRYGFVVESGLLLFILSAAAWLASDAANVRRLLRACVASGALGALYGIAQYFGWDPWLPASAYQAGEGVFTIVRTPGTLGHADYFAAWLVAIVFLALSLYGCEQAAWLRAAALISAALASTAIILSGTRSALLGLAAGAVMFAIVSRSRFRASAWITALVCALGITLLFFSPAGAKLRARVHWSSEDVWGGARLLLWRDSLRMAFHRPATGFGPDTFTTEFPRFESAELARAYPDFYHESPHNMFLDAFTSRGAVGLLLLCGFCALGLRAARHAIHPEITAALVAMLVSQQFVVFVIATALYFYLLIALLVTKPVRALPEPDRGWRWLGALSVAAGLVFAGCALQLLVSDRALAVTFRRIEAGDAAGAAREYATVLRWQPPGAGADLSYSRAMTQLASRSTIFATRLEAGRQALEAAIRATSSAEDRQNAWYNLAMLLAAQNDGPGVERALRNAAAWAPNWFKPHWALAQLLETTHRHAEAVEEGRLAFNLDGGRDPEVVETWKKLQQVSAAQP